MHANNIFAFNFFVVYFLSEMRQGLANSQLEDRPAGRSVGRLIGRIESEWLRLLVYVRTVR